MVTGTKRKNKSRPLVRKFLERVSSAAFSQYPSELTDLVGRQHGLYALYKRDHLYYVGLAKNLRGRIHNHLKDRLAGKWDRFSLYLIRKADHMKELESLLLRIAAPDGNWVTGHLGHAENMRNELKAKMKRAKFKEINEIFESSQTQPGGRWGSKSDGARSAAAKKSWRTRRKNAGTSRAKEDGRSLVDGAPPLAAYVKKPFTIEGRYKGKTYVARVRADGRIRYAGKVYVSPSGAACAIGGAANGWLFWHSRSADGAWVRLQELRRKGRN